MIVTIDGPAGAGKSSAARGLAERLGFRFLDTGAMYRAVTFAAIEGGMDLGDTETLAHLARRLSIELSDERVWVDGREVTLPIRSDEVTQRTHFAADNPGVRARLVDLQRAAAEGADVVAEGRDQGTVVFPAAECKFYLTASDEERARRRCEDLLQRGETVTFDQVLASQRHRDLRDQTRSVGPLTKAADAIEISTDGMTPAQVVDQLEALVRARSG